MEKFGIEKPKPIDPEDEESRHARLDAKPINLSKTTKGIKGAPYKNRVPGEMSDEDRSNAIKAAQEDEDKMIGAIDSEKMRGGLMERMVYDGDQEFDLSDPEEAEEYRELLKQKEAAIQQQVKTIQQKEADDRMRARGKSTNPVAEGAADIETAFDKKQKLAKEAAGSKSAKFESKAKISDDRNITKAQHDRQKERDV